MIWLSKTESDSTQGPKGQTSLWGSVRDSIAMFGKTRVGDAIVVITDGVDNGKFSARNLEPILLESGVRLFAVIQTPKSFVERIEGGEILSGSLRDLTIESGGMSFSRQNAADPDKLATTLNGASAIDDLARLISDDLVLEVELERPLRQMQPWRLELQDVPGLQKDAYSLYYPHKISGCFARSSFGESGSN
jgi:hypothetical protein